MDFSHYKAVLFDVDKTLTNSNSVISTRTRTAVQELSSHGIKTGVCSGRQFVTVFQLISDTFPSGAEHILSGGGEICKSDGTTLFSRYIQSELVQEIIERTNTQNGRLLLQNKHELFGNQKAIDRAESYFVKGEKVTIPKRVNGQTHWDTCALITIGDISDELVRQLQALPVQLKLMTGYSGNPYVDITAQGVTKATAIHEWCKITGIKPEEIIGFGDSENDLEFLQTVGFSVAMGNASESVKKIADEVTADCDHDGVAIWVEQNIKI